MRDFFLWLFKEPEIGPEITLFSVWHILYWLLIVGGAIGLSFLLKDKSQKYKTTVLRVLAYLLPIVYIADFFIMPLARTDMTIDIDKLPFHICTAMAIFAPLAQFNKKFEKVKDAICCLTIVASLMYITYPGSALGGVSPWGYKVVQTFVYHGLMLIWGVLSLTIGSVELDFKTIWKPLVGIAIVIVWASFGNAVYSNEDHHYDWFFVTGSTFPFIPEWLMPFVVFVAVGGMCAIIYAIYLGVKKFIEKRKFGNSVPFVPVVAELAATEDKEAENVESQNV